MGQKTDHLVDGKYGIQDLVEMDRLRKIFEMFTASTGFTIGFLDHPGLNILIATGWRDICTKYHRLCPVAAENCLRSNKHLLDQLTEPGKVVIEACDNGLVDCATPIIIKGKHIASLATGQLLLEKPDKDLFRRQAKAFGIGERVYLKALAEVPVVSEAQLKSITGLLGEIALIVSQLGYANLEAKEEAAMLQKEVAERKLVEKALRESEQKFRLLFERSKDGIVLISSDFDLIMVNEAFARMHGYTVEDMMRMNLKDIDVPQTFALAPERLQKCLAGEMLSFEVEHYCKNGGTILLDVSINSVTIKGESYLLGFHRDITARKQAENALWLKNLVFDSSIAANSIADVRGVLTEVNNMFLKMWGYPEKSDVIGKPVGHFLNDTDKAASIIEALKTTGQWEGDYVARKMNGSTFVAHGLATVVRDQAGQVVGYQSSVEDVTERKRSEDALRESEARYRLLLESTTDYIYSVRVENGCALETVHGPGCAAVTGRTPLEYRANPYLWYQMIYPEDRDKVLKMAERALKGAPVEPVEHRIYHRDGSIRWLRDTIVVKKDPAGQVVSYDGLVSDITDRKKAEEKLQESEKRLRLTLEATQIGIWDWDVKSDQWYASPTYYTMLGYEPRMDMADRNEWLERVHPDDLESVRDKISDVLLCNSRGYQYEARMRHADGSYRWQQVMGFGIDRDADGKVTRMLGLRMDITERRQSEERIRLLSTVVEQSMEGVSIAELDGRIIFSNETWCRMHGYKSPEELFNKNLSIFHNAQQMEKDVLPFNRQVLEQGACSGEVGHITRLGEIFPTFMTTILLKDQQGRPYAFAGIAQDITERKKVERELREYRDHLEDLVRLRTSELTLANGRLIAEIEGHKRTEGELENSRSFLDKIINSIPDPVFVKDRQHRFVLMNDAVCALMGKPREEIIGKDDNDFFPKDQVDVFWVKDEEVFVSGQENLNEEFFTDGKGVVRTIMTKKTLYTDKGGTQLIVGVIRDVTEIRQAASLVAAAQARMRHSEKMASLGQLVAGIAHEINNPCGYVLSNLDLLRQYEQKLGECWSAVKESGLIAQEPFKGLEDSLDVSAILKDMPNLISESIGGTERIARIVKDLRLFVHPQGGDWEWVDIHQVLKSAFNIVSAEFKDRVSLVRQYGDLPLVRVKEQQITQVFINLLTNAAQSIPEQGTVTIRTYAKDGNVCVEIADTGAGIAQEHLTKIFDPFFTTKPVGKGTGLGLSVVHSIIAQHRGTISVESRPGQGSTFFLALPVGRDGELSAGAVS